MKNGREAIYQLQNLLDDAKQVRETATGLDDDKPSNIIRFNSF